MSGKYYQIASPGKLFILTQKGYDNTPDAVKRERAVGKPLKGFEQKVPASWITKGYVIMIGEDND